MPQPMYHQTPRVSIFDLIFDSSTNLDEATAVALKPSEVSACLLSVPYDKQKDVEQIEWMQEIFQFQSTLSYLKNPPPTYPLPAVDIMGGLKNISTFIENGKYTNEYDIEIDLFSLISSANDSHLSYVPYLHWLFTYHRGLNLVSVSLDGHQLPKIYVLSDIKSLSNGTINFSPVSAYNGQSVATGLGFGRGQQDLDALYNSGFYSPSTAAAAFQPPGLFTTSPFRQQGDTNTITFENGTHLVVNATVITDTLSAKNLPSSGQEFFKFLTTIGLNSSTASPANPTSSASASAPVLPLPTHYPHPIMKHKQSLISGYFLNETDNADVAVLDIGSFEAPSLEAVIEVLQNSAAFLASCQSTGKRRLIVDVRNNGGGNVAFGYSLFSQLFPSMIPYSGIRIRASDAANALGQITSSEVAQQAGDSDLEQQPFNVHTLHTKTNGTNYTSWEQFYGPVKQYGDSFSNVGSQQFSSSQFVALIAAEVYNGTDIPPQVFQNEDITLLTDGQCGSTCATFSNLLISQGHVKTVTMGGRPNNQPMAVIGGTQGGIVFPFPTLQSLAQQAIALQANTTGNSSAQTSQVQKILGPLTLPPPIATSPNPGAVSVNLVDNVAENDSTVTPLQFSGGIPADCRTYYMPGDITSMANTWARVARGVKAGGKGLCVNGTMSSRGSAPSSATNGSYAGSNGSSPLTFQGGASVGIPVHLGYVGLAVVFEFVTMAFL
ncbi:hypothetical protein ACLMJK_009735 [Lecanora helva]